MLNKSFDLNVIFLFFLVLFSLNFFDATFIPLFISKYVRLVYLSIAIIISVKYLFVYRSGFIPQIQIIVISIIFSIFMAYFSWDQSIYNTIKVTIPYLLWIFFFYLVHKRFKPSSIEKIIVFFGVTYAVLYFFQFWNYANPMFGAGVDEFSERAGIIRVIFPGAGVFF